MKRRVTVTLLGIFALFSVLALIMGKVYKTGQDRPPLKYAFIPDSTLNHLRERAASGGEEGGIIVIEGGGGGENWSNEGDPGNDENNRWEREEDENFIVYYHRDKNARWQGNAQKILRCANDNIKPLTELMGKYFYPADVNDRKLAIYLPLTESEYLSVAKKILGRPGGEGSVGLTITSISCYGCKTEAILIHPNCLTDVYGESYYKTVLLHEMNHYVYRTAIDYSKVIDHKNWQIEGTADFNAGEKNHTYLSAEQQAEYISKRCNLREDFPTENIAQYWAGCSFLSYIEKTYGRDFVKSFIRNSYTMKSEEVFASLDLSIEEEHQKWVEFVRNSEATNDATLQ